MKLYTYPPAPSPQRVQLFMQEKGIELPAETIDMMKQEQLGDDFKAINPRSILPTLLLDDGTVLSEVIAICRYLEASFPETPLLGTSAKQQALISEWDHRIEMECLAAVADALRNKGDGFKHRALPGALDIEQIPDLIPRGILRVNAFFEILDKQLSQNTFVAGEHFSMADITAFVCVNFSGWIKVAVPETLDHLTLWHNAMSKRFALD